MRALKKSPGTYLPPVTLSSQKKEAPSAISCHPHHGKAGKNYRRNQEPQDNVHAEQNKLSPDRLFFWAQGPPGRLNSSFPATESQTVRFRLFCSSRQKKYQVQRNPKELPRCFLRNGGYWYSTRRFPPAFRSSEAQADKDLTEEQTVQYGDQDAEQRADKHL